MYRPMKSTGAKRRIFFPSACHNALYNSRRDLAASSPFCRPRIFAQLCLLEIRGQQSLPILSHADRAAGVWGYNAPLVAPAWSKRVRMSPEVTELPAVATDDEQSREPAYGIPTLTSSASRLSLSQIRERRA